MTEENFDQILMEMRDEQAGEAEAAACERVWAKLTGPAYCSEFQRQLPAYRGEEMAEAPRLLLEDHLARCAECRKALGALEGRNNVLAMPAPARRRWAVPRWAVAAGVALVGLYLSRDRVDALLAPGGPRATVEAASGPLYTMTGRMVKPGEGLDESEVIRTGAGSQATLRLADGSRVELNESSEMAVHAAWSGASILLTRGDLIVEAAKQRRGSLRVVTRDAVAAVKGTVFTVSTGVAGSLVGVVEGSVAVDQAGGQRTLTRGERTATSRSLEGVTVREAVSWSQDAERYTTLLTELSAIEKQLPSTAVRTSSRLVAWLPPDAQFYGSIPNLGSTMGRAVELIEQRSAESEVLREWWQSADAAQVKQVLERVQALTALLGEEIVFLTTRQGQYHVVLAEVREGRQAELAAAIERLRDGHPLAYRMVGNLLVATDTDAHMAAVLPLLGQGGTTPFAAEIGRRYAGGVTWLFGVDLTGAKLAEKAAEIGGIGNLRYVFVEQRNVQGADENLASLTFAGERKGVASWLAAPMAAASAEYVSSDAVFALSAATRNPRQIFDELASTLARVDSKLIDSLRQVEEKTGVQFSTDLAAALGTDFTFAVETPTVPIPGWVAAMEVYQPALFAQTMGKIVEAHNRQEENPERRLTLSTEIANGREWTTLSLAGNLLALHWTTDRGYLVLSSDRGLAERAIATRNGGFALVRSSLYREQLPSTATVHMSGFLWVHVNGALDGLPVAKNGGLQKLLASREPILMTFHGEAERIDTASRTRLSSLLFEALLTGSTKAKAEKVAQP